MAHLSPDVSDMKWSAPDGPRRSLVSAAWTLMIASSFAALALQQWRPGEFWQMRFTDSLWAIAMAFLVIWIAVHRTMEAQARRAVEGVAALAFLAPLPIHIWLHGGASAMQWLVGAGSPFVFAVMGILDCREPEDRTARRTLIAAWIVLALLVLMGIAALVFWWWLDRTCAFCF